MAASAAVFGVIAIGLIGLAIFAAVVVVLLAVELWRESARLTKERDSVRYALTTSESDLALARLEIESLRETRARADKVEHDLSVAKGKIARLRSQPFGVSVEQLLEGLASHLRAIELAQKHRALEQTGARDWPVVRLTMRNREVHAVAFGGEHSGRFFEEPVAVLETSSGRLLGEGQLGLESDNELSVDLQPDSLPDHLHNQLVSDESMVPEGLAFRLFGLTLSPYAKLSEEQLSQLRESALSILAKMQDALTSHQEMNDQEPIDEVG